MWFVTFVLKNIVRRRIRSILTVVSLSVAVGSVVALVGIATGFQSTFLDVYRQHGVDVVVFRAGMTDRVGSTIDESAGEQIRRVSGVGAVEPILLDAVSLESAGLYGVVVQGFAPGSSLIDDFDIVQGRALRADDSDAVMLGESLAKNLGKRPGDRVELFEEVSFEVVGTFESRNIFENGSMVTSLPNLQALIGREGQVTMFNVMVDDPADAELVEQVRSDIEGLRDIEGRELGLDAMPTQQFVDTDTRIRVAGAMAWATSAIALVVGAIGMLNTMVMSVFERTREIGVLRAIGWRKSRVVRMIVMESIVLSISGAICGSLGAILLTRLLSRLPAVGGMVGESIDSQVVILGFAIAIAIGLIGAAYPAYLGARLLPTDALRHE